MSECVCVLCVCVCVFMCVAGVLECPGEEGRCQGPGEVVVFCHTQ